MAYSTGSVSSMADLLTALTNAGTANGWTWADGILHSGDCHIQLASTSDTISALAGLGKSGSTLLTPAPAATYLRAVLSAVPISFPCTYHLFAKSTEIYLVVNHATSYYTHLAFGQSRVTGMTGKGVWVSGTAYTSNTSSQGRLWLLTTGENSGNYSAVNSEYARFGLFLSNNVANGPSAGCYAHHGLAGWSDSTVFPRTLGGARQLHVMDNPAANWNGQTYLSPIQPWIDRGSSKVSVVADLLYARYARLDNLEPGDTITLGADQWKVFPIFKKNADVRNGGAEAIGTNAHTGTYGYAFKV